MQNREKSSETSTDIKDAEKSNEKVSGDSDDIEYILNDLGGSYGKFQIWNYILFSIPVLISGLYSILFVFTTLNVEYRCHIPECDDIENPSYNADFVQHAIPQIQSTFAKCQKYSYNDTFLVSEWLNSNIQMDQLNVCPKEAFDQSEIVRCDGDGFIYRTDEISIANEFHINCEENRWKLNIIGSYNNIARMAFLPLIGFLSDTYGRRKMLIGSLFLASIAGMIQSFSVNYTMFVVCEVFCAIVACPIFTSTLVLGLEWAGNKERAIASAIVTFPFHIGSATIGIIAAMVHHFRPLLRWAYGPAMLASLLVYFGPESMRWLLAKGKRDTIEQILKRGAKINNIQLSNRTFEIVERKCTEIKGKADENSSKDKPEKNPIVSVLTSRTLFFRIIISSLCWFTGNYVSQGITISSVSLEGDKYVNFIVLSLGGVPAAFVTIPLLRFVGRRSGISICYLIASVTAVLGRILLNSNDVVAMILFLNARCFVMAGYLIVYIYSSELWPTNIRATMVGISSTLGRLGAVISPLSPLLSSIAEILPFLSYGIMALITGILVLLLPETKNTKLPETMDDALHLGKTNTTSNTK